MREYPERERLSTLHSAVSRFEISGKSPFAQQGASGYHVGACGTPASSSCSIGGHPMKNTCDLFRKVHRRDFLRVGGLGLCGITMLDLLRAQGSAAPVARRAKAKHLI